MVTGSMTAELPPDYKSPFNCNPRNMSPQELNWYYARETFVAAWDERRWRDPEAQSRISYERMLEQVTLDLPHDADKKPQKAKSWYDHDGRPHPKPAKDYGKYDFPRLVKYRWLLTSLFVLNWTLFGTLMLLTHGSPGNIPLVLLGVFLGMPCTMVAWLDRFAEGPPTS